MFPRQVWILHPWSYPKNSWGVALVRTWPATGLQQDSWTKRLPESLSILKLCDSVIFRLLGAKI